jgi:UDPglucose 6-dehydrogenase
VNDVLEGCDASVSTRIGFIGLGKLGLPCAGELAKHHHLEGYDIRQPGPCPFPVVGSVAAVCAKKDVIFIAVPTPHDPAYGGEAPSTDLPPRDFDYGTVRDVLSEVALQTTSDQLVVLISTVLPGSVRHQFKPLVHGLRLIYNPYLIAMGSVARDMVNPEMLIIGTDDGLRGPDVDALLEIYRPVMQDSPRAEVGTWEEAECIKIFYNTFISTKISFVNMIQDVAERIGNTDVDIVTRALMQSERRITGPAYMTAGMGDGGSCHPRDNIALRWLASDLDLGYDLFHAIMESREMQARNLATYLVELAEQSGASEIWIHGKAFKPLVSYTEGSYSLLVAYFIREQCREVGFVDPLTGDARQSIQGVILLAHAASVTYEQPAQANSARLYCEFEHGSVVVDPWRMIREEDVPGCTVVHYGNTRTR